MVVFLAALQNIDPALYEAAKVDGASTRQAFRHITLPMLKPAILFLAIITSSGYLQLFEEPFVLTGGGPLDSTLSVSMYIYEQGFRFINFGYASAIAYALFVAIIALAAVQFRVLPIGDLMSTRSKPPRHRSPRCPPRPTPRQASAAAAGGGSTSCWSSGCWSPSFPSCGCCSGRSRRSGSWSRSLRPGCRRTRRMENYERLFHRLDFPRFFWNSTVIAVMITVANLLFCSMVGLRPGQAQSIVTRCCSAKSLGDR